MTLRTCRIHKGSRKKQNRLDYARNKNVYAGGTLSDRCGRTWARLRFCLFGLMNQMSYLLCVGQRTIVLISRWKDNLFHFCPSIKSFTPSQPLIVGHRGNPFKAVENTLPACKLALSKLRAEALEIDLCITKDEQVILWHDWNPGDIQAIVRQMGLEPKVRYRPYVPADDRWLKPVSQLTLDEFRRHYNYSRKWRRYKSCGAQIPLLEDFFNWAAGQDSLKAVFLDVKIPPKEKDKARVLIAEVQRLADKFKPSFEIIFLTPEEEVLTAMRRISARFNYSLDVVLPLIMVPDPVDYSAVDRARHLHNLYASVGRPTSLDIAPWTTYRQIIAHDRRQMQENPPFPKKLVAWTINKRSEMRCLAKMGVDAILTDRPNVLARINYGPRFIRLLQRKSK